MATITEDFCSYEVAKLLKEKGFDIECNTAYYNGSLIDYTMYGFCIDGEFIFAPTHQMAMKWLRKIYGIDIVIEISDPSVKDRKYYCVIWNKNNDSYILDLFSSYEECVEAAIKYCLENLIYKTRKI